MAPDASFLGVETLVFGRAAMGERVRTARLRDLIRVRRGNDLLLHDAIRLEGEVDAVLARPAVAAGARALATVVHVAPDAEARLDRVREVAPASAWNGMLVARSPGPRRGLGAADGAGGAGGAARGTGDAAGVGVLVGALPRTPPGGLCPPGPPTKGGCPWIPFRGVRCGTGGCGSGAAAPAGRGAEPRLSSFQQWSSPLRVLGSPTPEGRAGPPPKETRMNLTPREKDKLLISMAAMVARRRLERGVKLNHPEAVALISDFVVEGARDGRSVADLMEAGASVS